MSGKKMGEMLAALGVIASMIFVGLEIRQNTVAVQGATLQAISDSYTGFIHTNSLDSTQREIELMVFAGALRDDLTPDQHMQMLTNLIAWIGLLENTFVQHRLGLVDEAVFDAYGWNRNIHRTPYFQEWWNTYARAWVSSDFREFFEARVQIGADP